MTDRWVVQKTRQMPFAQTWRAWGMGNEWPKVALKDITETLNTAGEAIDRAPLFPTRPNSDAFASRHLEQQAVSRLGAYGGKRHGL